MQNFKGAKITTPGPMGTIHEGILAGYDANKNPWVIENSKVYGQVVYRPMQAGEKWQVVKPAPHGYEDVIINRALALCGKKYDVTAYNCQHFVSEVYTGMPASWQLNHIGIVLGLVTVAALLGQETPAKKRASNRAGN